MIRRTNLYQCRIVELAIVLADAGLIAGAAEMCHAKNIPLHVTLRVLTMPKKRRRST